MASNKNALAMCDICGFVYPHRVMQENSYGLIVCPTDFEGNFDLKNHPQNHIPDVRDNPAIRNPRPDTGGRNLTWDQAATTWDSTNEYWQLI
tara:strand:+ start:1140 stop:1415 length:276 start_codon:yes stop_codon:yes gene_type:complete